MTCAEFQEQVAALALGALDSEEAAACQAHLAEPVAHTGCAEALARANATTGRLADALPPVRPGDAVWRGIEARIGAEAAPPSRGALRETVAWALAAAAAVALYITASARVDAEKRAEQGVVMTDQARESEAARQRCRIELESLRGAGEMEREAIALLAQPGTRAVSLAPVAGAPHRATAIVNAAAKRAIVVSSAMPAVEGKDYQLWVIRGQKAPQPAGFLRPTARGLSIGEIDRKLLEAAMPEQLAVSLEPAGGAPTPTTVLVAGPVKS